MINPREESYKEGASSSLRKTISEIMQYMEDDVRENGDLRSVMYRKMAAVSAWWFQEGFSIAHRIILDKVRKGEPIENISFEHDEAFLAPETWESVELIAPMPSRPDKSWTI
ncbi:MAG: hypothetical protein ACRYG4_10730 [Janthinobacterium lividum]